jgi:hypothetical protein
MSTTPHRSVFFCARGDKPYILFTGVVEAKEAEPGRAILVLLEVADISNDAKVRPLRSCMVEKQKRITGHFTELCGGNWFVWYLWMNRETKVSRFV